MHHLQILRKEPKSRATAAAATAAAENEGAMEPVPEVGLGAGASAAMAGPMRAQTETTTTTSIRKALETAIVIENLKNSSRFSNQMKIFKILCVVGLVRQVGSKYIEGKAGQAGSCPDFPA
ncbi:hypothetical protein V6N13_120803 [Hibiscus sabdariffa]|uniref:Uncharacterized protein n=1 Tax=Hibiscus sabdariffa TaxID=183260 RepID=A0ABR2E5F6_9ROSI